MAVRCKEVSIHCGNTHPKINQQLDSSLAHLCLRQFLSSSGIGAGGRCAVGCFPGHRGEVTPPRSLPTSCQGHCLPRVMTIKSSVNLDKYLPIDVGPRILPFHWKQFLCQEENIRHHVMRVRLPLGPIPFRVTRAQECVHLYILHTAQPLLECSS